MNRIADGDETRILCLSVGSGVSPCHPTGTIHSSWPVLAVSRAVVSLAALINLCPDLLQVCAAKGGSCEEHWGTWQWAQDSEASPWVCSVSLPERCLQHSLWSSPHPLPFPARKKSCRGDVQPEEQQCHHISGVLLSHPVALNTDLPELQSPNWWFSTKFLFFSLKNKVIFCKLLVTGDFGIISSLPEQLLRHLPCDLVPRQAERITQCN